MVKPMGIIIFYQYPGVINELNKKRSQLKPIPECQRVSQQQPTHYQILVEPVVLANNNKVY